MKGGHEKGGQKGGQPFRMLVPTKYTIICDSDKSFRGHIFIFWHNHYGISDIAICPPFAPLFSKFLFLKKVELHILSESKINLIWRLVPKIRYFKVKNVVFYLKVTKGMARSESRSSKKSLILRTSDSSWNQPILSSRNAIDLIFGANFFSDDTFYNFSNFEKGGKNEGEGQCQYIPHIRT